CAPHFCGPDVFKHQMINGYLQKNSLAFSTGIFCIPIARTVRSSLCGEQKSKAGCKPETPCRNKAQAVQTINAISRREWEYALPVRRRLRQSSGPSRILKSCATSPL